MIYKVLIIFVLVLYGNWIFLMFYYPLMVLGAMGSKEKNRKKAYLLCFPLRVPEHFLRFGGGQICTIPNRKNTIMPFPKITL